MHRHISYAEVGFWVRGHRPWPQQPRTSVASWVSNWEPSVMCQAIPLQRALPFQLASWNHLVWEMMTEASQEVAE